MKNNTSELHIDHIGSQTERISPEEEKALAKFFKNLKLKYQLEREADEELHRKNQTAK